MLGDGELRKGNLQWIWGNFGYEGRGLCVSLGEGVLLGERGVTEREFIVDWGGFRGGIGAERSGAKRSEAERSVAERSVA